MELAVGVFTFFLGLAVIFIFVSECSPRYTTPVNTEMPQALRLSFR
jgi:hypothetical protein